MIEKGVSGGGNACKDVKADFWSRGHHQLQPFSQRQGRKGCGLMTILYSGEQRTEDVSMRTAGILRRGKKTFECEGMETVKGWRKLLC